ncbi:hypothetical protein [Microbacterium sp. zg-YB36]|uniref:hypothetical protein n=1 Tax=Microbacterium sp. zg-YB36 TaxID=2969407 RepID=UPI00214C1524|nr:hypothetical protein [Microbacterium sp. zg-YB36]MDL5351147.1 hypothetical protein [Microbacterium sp. zg-YB36]
MTTASSSSDRYEAARAALAEYDMPGSSAHHADDLAAALRALIEPAATEENVDDIAERLSRQQFEEDEDEVREHVSNLVAHDSWESAPEELRQKYLARTTAAVNAGILAAWNSWEPDDYAPVQCAKCGADTDEPEAEPAEALPLDPEPWASLDGWRWDRNPIGDNYFAPRPGYSQNKEDYA